MSERIVVLDETIFEQINLGNEGVAKAVRNLRLSGAQLWITAELDSRLRIDADRRLIRDLNIQSLMQDTYAKNPVMQRYTERLPAHNQTTGSLVIHLSKTAKQTAELLSADKVFSDRFNRYYGNIAPESAKFKTINGAGRFNGGRDYNHSRRLLNLKPLNVTLDGKVLPTPPIRPPTVKVTPRQPTVPVLPKVDPKENAGKVAAAKGAAVQIIINGVSAVLGWIADEVQRRRFEADWEPKKRHIEQEMAKDTSLGVLVFVYYTVMQGSRRFEYIRYEFGRTRHEAFKRFQRRSNMDGKGPGDLTNNELGWFPPLQPIEPHKLPTPFPVEALATFAGGRDLVMDVKWKGKAGFDETGETRLGVPTGLDPLFLVLKAPEEIPFNNGSLRHTAYIDLAYEFPAETDMPMKAYLTTVEFDSWYNPFSGDTSAAMVFPAERYTETLFRKAPAIKGVKGQLYYHGLEDVRFVEPENIRVIQDYRMSPPKN